MSSKNKRLYAIALIDTGYLRDHKLRRLEDDTIGEPDYDVMLSMRGRWPRPIHTPTAVCPFTGNTIRQKFGSVSKWLTIKGCKAALSRFESNPALLREVSRLLMGKKDFQAVVVDITKCWNDTINTQILIEKKGHEIRMNKLLRQMI